jgi:hypothetical protein
MSTKNTIDLKYLRSIKAVVWLQGREYLTHNGLLRVAHEVGLKSIQSELIHWNAEKKEAVIKTVVVGERGTYTGYGDASPANVAKHLREATLRMAETRAVNRALRLYTGLGMTTTEELPGDHEAEETPALPRLNRSSKAFRTPTMVDTQSSGCAVCGKLVSNDQARMSQEAHDVVMCESHQEIWERAEDESFTEEARAIFIERLETMSIEYNALELRCMASPQWQKRPAHMTGEERERLLTVLQQHHDRKNTAAS